MQNLDKYFEKSDLIPAIIFEEKTKEVLMLAYMNRESLELSLKTGYTNFYSRSRKCLWKKGSLIGPSADNSIEDPEVNPPAAIITLLS